MLNLQDWLDEHESPRAMGGAIMYVRSDDLRTLVDQIRLEQAASVPQDVEEFIESSERQMKDVDGFIIDAVYTDDLREWMAGHARVPVEPTDAMIDALFPGEGEHIVRDLYRAMLTASKESGK